MTITAKPNTKTYDATTSAAATPTVAGLVAGDTVTGLSETYDTKNAGTGKTLTVAAGYTVSDGNSGGNYTVTTASSTAGVINKAALTITALTNTKTYDATTSAAATPTVSGLQGSDTVTGLSETYDTKNAGTGKTLSVAAGYTVSDGNSGGNYTVTTASSTAGVISKAALTITALSNTKTYDATTSAAATPAVSGLQGSDTVTGLSETYDTKNVGTGKTLSVAAGYTVSDGNSGGNYTLTTASSTAGVINKAALAITALSNTKTYDATTSAAATPTVSGLQGSDTVTGLSETYDTKNVGTGKTLSVAAGYTLSDGNSGANYTVTTASSTAGVINKAALTITALANTKTYDATTSAAATPTVSGLLGSDTVTGLSETYDNKNAGTGKTLSVAAGYAVNDGNSGNNYLVSLVTSTTGQITPLAITVTAAASTKTYDGTPTSTATPTIFSGAVVSTLAGSAGQTGSSNDTGSAARFYHPAGVAVDSAGNVYVADLSNQEIRKITPSGVVTTLAGSAGQTGSSNGTGSAARFNGPYGVAVDSAGNVYVADENNQEIREITPSGVVTTLAGSAGQSGSSNGTGSAARFDDPWDVAVDSAGNVYVADGLNDEIREITPSGAVTTLAGSAGQIGSSNGTGSAARFSGPSGVAVDGAGNVYVADLSNQEIRKITPSGVVSTLAGFPAQRGSSDGTGSAARFDDPSGVVVDSAGNVYVADVTNQEIRKITPSGVVTTLAGSAGQTGSSNGTGSAARFYVPYGVAVDTAGNVYVADYDNDQIRLVNLTGLVGSDTADFSETYDTKNVGTGKTLTPFGSVSDGNGGQNYTVTFVNNTAGVINKAPLAITALTNTKTYDATTSAAATPTVSGLQGSDTVTGLSETYDNKNAGTGKTLSVAAGYTVSDGNSGGNYTVTTASSTAGVINKAALTITAVSNTKTYDATTSAAATPTVSGLQGSDTATGLSETYDTKNVGTGKTLSVAAGYTVSDGNSGGNYTVTTASSTAGVINKAALTITAARQHQDLRRHNQRRGDADGERPAGQRHGDGTERDLRHEERGHGQDARRWRPATQ